MSQARSSPIARHDHGRTHRGRIAAVTAAAAVLVATGAGSLVSVGVASAANPPAVRTAVVANATATAAPKITSPSSLTVHPGTKVSFTITTTGTPVPGLLASGQLPGGMTFTAGGNGTATIAGTPSQGSTGTYNLDVTASNGVTPDASQTLTISVVPVGTVPSFTSPSSYQLASGYYRSIAVVATGSPVPSLTASGGLPAGMSFQAGGNGTATISGVPGQDGTGTYTLYVTASNSLGVAHQTLTISVVHAEPVTFTSPGSLTMHPGDYTAFTVRTSGLPAPTIVSSGRLPAGVAFTAQPGGTATIAGDPPATAIGTYAVDLTATNDLGVVAHQSIRLVVNEHSAPAITSPSSFDVRGGTYAKLTVSATGNPTPGITLSGRLPYGLHYKDNGNGTGYIYGTPGRTISGAYPVQVTATNGIGNPAHQTVELHVALAPTITFTSKASVGLTAGRYGKLAVRTVASPAARLTLSGRLPLGIRFFPKSGGLAYLAGTPWRSAVGRYAVTIAASNGTARPVSQRLVISVSFPPSAPVLYGARSLTTRVHAYAKLRIVATGSPVPRFTLSGRLPAGLRFVAPPGHRVVFVAGRPWASSAGDYQLVLTVQNGVGQPVREELRIVVLT